MVVDFIAPCKELDYGAGFNLVQTNSCLRLTMKIEQGRISPRSVPGVPGSHISQRLPMQLPQNGERIRTRTEYRPAGPNLPLSQSANQVGCHEVL